MPELYGYQSEGVVELVRRRAILLADDMGLGKTAQAISAISKLFSDRAIRRVLIVAPASLCANWMQEFRVWAPSHRPVRYAGADRHGMLRGGAKVLVATIDTVVGDLKAESRGGARFIDIGVDLLVIDEAQSLGNPSSLRSLVLSRILAPRRWAITGTPMENHPGEFLSIVRFILQDDSILSVNVRENSMRLLAIRDRYMVRRTKEDVSLDLPSKTSRYVFTDLTPDQEAEYAQVLDELRSGLLLATTPAAATALLLPGIQDLRRIAALSSNGTSGKLDLIEQEVEALSAKGEKAIVFSTYATLALPLVRDRLERFGAEFYTGDMSLDERTAAHERFINDANRTVMCASLKAAGVGLTWTVASYVYFLDLWWNPQALRQAEDRAHRIGQARPVFCKRLVAMGTIDEAIASMLQSKQELFTFFVEDSASGVEKSPDGIGALLRLIDLKFSDLKAFRSGAS